MPLDALQALLDEARGDIPAWISIALADPAEPQAPLYPIEEAAVARAIVTRRSEFAAGRHAARRAMSDLGHPPEPLPMGEDRAPVWPAGLTGSISHISTACIAMSARTDQARAIGVDLEVYQDFPPETVPEVAKPRETALFDDPKLIAVRRIFSAKEAGYKAQYALSRTVFGFDRLALCRSPRGDLALKFTNDAPPFRKGDLLRLRQWVGHGLILSLVTLPVLHNAIPKVSFYR
ncbi:4'-phosphopantetheinyl transferase family protein [Puniceibacterium confluentis]|uniref:4'-phosphopantetheinyl transferase family protein n=1 Tax=Puniceibacterium confluentis TaxID=1958944 RepID=UPI0011B76FE0|nr:4'-phosphopantetheinyl transferase superfamily protein [Puniceibacterium confluentis]